MQLSEQTLTVLKNFSGINPNLVFRKGNELKTISVAKNILSKVTIAETIPDEFGIYDLPEFLSVMSMFDKPDLTVSSQSVKVADGAQSLTYNCSPLDNLVTPSKDITMPTAEIEFTLTEADLNKVIKAASVMGYSELQVCGDAGTKNVYLKVTDSKNMSSNKFELNLGTENVVRPDNAFSMVFNPSLLKLIPGDYRVKLSSKLISNFKNTSSDIQYWIALERNSVFG